MDEEIETYEHECEVPAQSLAAVGDGLPAFGIVAAVMGVVHTMESVGAPPAELGMLVAHALALVSAAQGPQQRPGQRNGRRPGHGEADQQAPAQPGQK